MEDGKKRHFFADIERLRGFACILILIQHIAWICPVYFIHMLLPDVLLLGSGAFRVFFAISGFAVTYSIKDSLNEFTADVFMERLRLAKPFLSAFYKRRFFRIMPVVFFVMLLCGMFFSFTDFTMVEGKTDWARSFFRVPFEILFGVYNNSLHLYQTSNRIYSGGLGPFWTLAVESQFYLIWPIALLFCKNNNARMIMSLTLGCVFLFVVQPAVGALIENKYYIVYNNLSELFFGSFLAFLHDKNFTADTGCSECGLYSKVAVIALAMAVWCYPSCLHEKAFFSDSVVSFSAIFLVAFAVFAEGVFDFPCLGRIFKHLGSRSYSFYSVQLTLANFVVWYTESAFFCGESLSKYEFYLCQFIMFLVVLFVFSEIMYRFIEKPMRKFGRVASV